MSRRPSGRASASGLPIPVYSRGSPANSTASSQGLRGRGSLTHSTEDISRQYGSSLSPSAAARRATSPAARRSVSPGQGRRPLLSPARRQSHTENTQQPGVRYITEDLVRKVAKEDNLDLITSVNLTLAKEGGKKIKYIENLDKLRKLQTLNLAHNMIEKMERLDRLVKLRDLNLCDNMLTKIEGIESLVTLQSLNVSDNRIEHIPLWLAKKLKALRTFRIARNCLESLSEMSKLKPLPDLIQLDVAGNPLSDLPHGRLYVVFHLRTVEILDGQTVSDGERRNAQQRFEQEEVEQLEKRLEQEETKVRQLEESHNKSVQERTQQQTSASELASKERDLQEKLKKMEQELNAKDDLLKKKSSDLNKASQKHYELEQELAFYKIDSKFDSLNEAPKFNVDVADDSSDLNESPYIGRARYRANQFAHESTGNSSPSPQRASTLHSARRTPSLASPGGGGGILRRSLSPPTKFAAQAELDAQLEQKHAEVQKTEAKLRSLQDDLSATEKKLMNATTELKKISTDRVTPEPFRDDNKYKIRQRLARKMQKVNEMREAATQMEEEIDRKNEKLSQDRSELHRLQSQLSNTDPNSFGYNRKESEVHSKEGEINESSRQQVEMQKQLEEALTNIARETTDIKTLEQQLSADQIEQNDELRHELDDIVSGLSGYLENVKGQSKQHKQEFEMLISEKEALEEKIRRMEGELNILEGEAANARWMQKRLSELEDSLRKTEDLNTTLQGEVDRSRQKDPEVQERLQRAEDEARQLRQSLKETERKAEAERQATQKQIQAEKERADKMTHKIQDVNRQELEAKKLVSQLEAAKALNAGLRDQVEEFRHKQQMEEGGFKPSDLKKRLKKFTHEFKTNKNPIEPQGKNDYLGLTFQDLQKHAQDQMNNSAKEVQDLKKSKQKAEAEIQTLKEKMKQVASKAEMTKEEKRAAENNRKLQDEIKRLKKALEETKNRNSEGAIPVRIVYRPDSENSGDRASSLNSDEKQLFDELQRELMDLKRSMRSHEDDLSKKLVEAETEAAHYKEEMKQKEKEYEAEMEEHRQAMELMREKQEARIQVIAQDLDQAQFVADSLQHLLEERERVLNDELGNADMSNQMISAQEDELARLYDILETQRDEIENLNQILDHLAQQGPDGVGAGFDDELWRIRQEVNNLKETLAMQSAYVQAMPGVGNMATQAGLGVGVGPDGGVAVGGGGLTYNLQGQGHVPPVRSSGAAAGTQVDAQHYGSAPTIPSKGSSGQANMTTATGRPHGGQSTSGRVARPGSMQMAGAAMASTPMPRSAQSLGVAAGEPRVHPMEHLGTERRESRAPHGGRSAVGGKGGGDGLPPQAASRAHDKGFDSTAGGGGRGSRRSSRSRAPRPNPAPSAFEPVHRPEPHHPLQQTVAYQPPPPPPVAPGVPVGGVTGAQMMSGGVTTAGGQPTGQQMMPGQAGANRMTQTVAMLGQGRPTQGFHPEMTGVYPGGVTGGVAPNVAPPPGAAMAGAGYGMVGRAVPLGYSYMQAGGADQAVAFDPVPQEISFNPSGDPGSGYPYGGNAYMPVSPGNNYMPGRMFVQPSAVPGQQDARIYYPPPQGYSMPVVPGAPMVPMATGTPVKGGGFGPPMGFFDGSFINAPPSPIRPVGADAAPRGILKNGAGEQTTMGDNYRFCNVPEHHDLEDYIAELQDKIKKLKSRVNKEKDFHEDTLLYEDRKAIKRLLSELEDRRDELEGLDLAIERQKHNLQVMKLEERELVRDKRDARTELDTLKKRNDKRILARRREDSFDEEMERSRQKYLETELACLEKSVAKRTGQLREAEKSLKDVNADLKAAKDQCRDTVLEYDQAASNLRLARQELQELEKRSHESGVELVTLQERLVSARSDYKSAEKQRAKQERLLREVNNVISKKDSEFKELDNKVKATSVSLERLEADYLVHSQREKEMVDALRDSDDILSKKRVEIQKMKDQIEQNRKELERLDQQMGRRKTELQLLTETQERKREEFQSVMQDAEAEIAAKQRDIKDCKEEMGMLEQQKTELSAHIKARRQELQQVKGEVEQEEEVLQRLTSGISRHKSELKHVLEMHKLEQTELEGVKSQHAQKMAELERTQRAMLEEKGDLEQITAETARKSAELERLRQAIERDRLEVDQLTSDKQNLDDRISNLTRERDLLSEGCKTLDDKLNTMKRNHGIMEEKIEAAGGRLESLETEMRLREREMSEAQAQKEMMEKDVYMLKQNIKEGKTELKTLQDTIREAEDQMRGIDQDVRNTFHQRDEAKQELERINEQIRQSTAAYEDHARQERVKYKELQDLIKSLDERESEQQEARTSLNKVRKDLEREENKLNRLVSSANADLESVRKELTAKEAELDLMRREYTDLQKNCDELDYTEEKHAEITKKCRDLEKDLKDRDDEKTELAKALSASYEEVQRLRKETSEIQEKMARERAQMENTIRDLQVNLETMNKEMQQAQGRASNQVSELQTLAEKHFNRANTLEAELSRVKKDVVLTKKQSDKLSDDKENKTLTEVRIVPAPTSSVTPPTKDSDWKNDALRGRLAEEQDYLRFQLRQQMLRHSETMESAKIKSEETIDCLRRKLNSLQEILFTSNPDIQAIREMTRTRSRSPAYRTDFHISRHRSPSPLHRSPAQSYLAQRRSRSSDSMSSLGSPTRPEPDYL